MTGSPGDDDGDAQFAKLEREFARLMERFDKVTGHSGEVEGELDPELERELQLAVAHFLARPAPKGLTPEELGDEDKVALAVQEHIKPLFDTIFATALVHAKAAREAIREGRDPALRKTSPTASLDLTDILEDDS